MKYLVLVLVILLVVWLAKSARGRPERPAARPGPPEAGTAPGEVMLVCAQCGVHLPSGEALPGRGGVYCSEAHRAIAESHDRAG